MHDIKAIRDDSKSFVEGLKRRGLADAQQIADKALAEDRALRALQTRLQEAQARRNEASKLIGQAKAKKDEAGARQLMAEVAGLKDEIQKGEEQERELAKGADGFSCRTFPIFQPPMCRSARTRTTIWKSRRALSAKPPSIERRRNMSISAKPLGMMDFEARRESVRRAFRVSERRLGAPRTRHRQFHAGSAHGEIRLHGSFTAVAGSRSSDVWHGTIAKVRDEQFETNTYSDAQKGFDELLAKILLQVTKGLQRSWIVWKRKQGCAAHN